jgi:hypothetical protein
LLWVDIQEGTSTFLLTQRFDRGATLIMLADYILGVEVDSLIRRVIRIAASETGEADLLQIRPSSALLSLAYGPLV